MRTERWLAASLVLAASFASGCGQSATPPAPAQTSAHEEDAHDHDGHDHDESQASSEEDGHDHSGWWCDEHGVPEEVCAQCNSKLAAEFQRNGDWCAEHDRPDSQCFVCHPDLEARFADQYEAKYGTQPPPPQG